MNWLKKTWSRFTSTLLGVAIEEDRAVQEVVWDDGVDKTISGEAGSRPALNPLRIVLDATLPGGAHGKHSENAAYDDAAQQAALDKAEGTAKS